MVMVNEHSLYSSTLYTYLSRDHLKIVYRTSALLKSWPSAFLEWPGCFLELSEDQKCKRPLENFHMVPTLLTCLPNANHISGFHRAVLNTYISLLASTLCSKQSKCSKKILNSKIWPISHNPLLLSALIISSIFGGQRKMDMVDVQNAWVSNLFLKCTVM